MWACQRTIIWKKFTVLCSMLSRATGIDYLCYLFHIHDLGRENKIDFFFFNDFPIISCFSLSYNWHTTSFRIHSYKKFIFLWLGFLRPLLATFKYGIQFLLTVVTMLCIPFPWHVTFILYLEVCTFHLEFVVVVQLLSRVWFCHAMDCSMPGLPILLYLPEFA